MPKIDREIIESYDLVIKIDAPDAGDLDKTSRKKFLEQVAPYVVGREWDIRNQIKYDHVCFKEEGKLLSVCIVSKRSITLPCVGITADNVGIYVQNDYPTMSLLSLKANKIELFGTALDVGDGLRANAIYSDHGDKYKLKAQHAILDGIDGQCGDIGHLTTHSLYVGGLLKADKIVANRISMPEQTITAAKECAPIAIDARTVKLNNTMMDGVKIKPYRIHQFLSKYRDILSVKTSLSTELNPKEHQELKFVNNKIEVHRKYYKENLENKSLYGQTTLTDFGVSNGHPKPTK